MICPYCHATDHSSLGKCPRWTGAKFRAPPVCTTQWDDKAWADWVGPLSEADRDALLDAEEFEAFGPYGREGPPT